MDPLSIVMLIVGVLGVSGGLFSSLSTNSTNVKMAEEANKTNKELAAQSNATNIALAEDSYQKSTASNQLAELRRAGFSDQQAKLLLSSSFSPAAASPATVTPATVAAPQVTPAFDASMLSGIAEPLRMLFQDSASNPTGGLIGASLAEPIVSTIGEHIDELKPTQIATPANFLAYAKSEGAPDWAKELVSSDGWKKMRRSILGVRAFNDWFKSNNALNTWEQEYKHNGIKMRITAINEEIAGLQEQKTLKELTALDLENIHKDIENFCAQLQLDYDEALFNMRINFEHAQLRAGLRKSETEEKMWDDPKYQQLYIQRNMENEEFQLALLTYQKMILSGQTSLLASSPTAQTAISVGRILGDSQITDQNLLNTLYMSLTDEECKKIKNDVTVGIDEKSALEGHSKAYKIAYYAEKAINLGVTVLSAVKGLGGSTPPSSVTRTVTNSPKGSFETITERSYGN